GPRAGLARVVQRPQAGRDDDASPVPLGPALSGVGARPARHLSGRVGRRVARRVRDAAIPRELGLRRLGAPHHGLEPESLPGRRGRAVTRHARGRDSPDRVHADHAAAARRMIGRGAIVLAWILLVAVWPAVAPAQERPRSGGTLLYAVGAEPASLDAHREDSF